MATISYFGINREAASWPFSLCIATASFSGVLVGMLIQVISVRQILFITGLLVALGHMLCFLTFYSVHWVTASYGIVTGFGTGFVTPCLAIMTNSYFSKARVTANGISLSGTTCGAFVFPVLTNYLLMEFGLPGTFLVLAGFGLNALVGASMLRTRSPSFFHRLAFKPSDSLEPCLPEKSEADETTSLRWDTGQTSCGDEVSIKLPEGSKIGGPIFETFFATIKDSMFWVVAMSALSSIMVLMLFTMIIVDHAVDIGMSKSQAVLLLPIFSVPDLVGRLCTGWISDKGYMKRHHIYMITKTTSGILLMFLPVIRLDVVIYLFCGVLGLLEGSATILTNVLFMDYLGLKRLPAALSLWSFSLGAVFLGTPPLIGIFRDVYGKYDRLFYLMGGVSVLTSAIWWLEPSIMKYKARSSTFSRTKNTL